METFEVITNGQLDQQQARALLQGCFADMIGEVQARGGFVPQTAEPELEQAEQISLSKEVQGNLQDQVTSSKFFGCVQNQTRTSLGLRGVKLDALGHVSQLDLLSGIARAMIERERLFQLRVVDRLGAYAPTDALFAATDPQSIAASPATIVTGPSITEAVAAYLKHGENLWRPKTLAARKVQLGFLIEQVGPDLPLVQITADHIRAFRDALRRLHKRHGKMVGASFTARQTLNKAHQISDTTALSIFGPAKVFFKWAVSDEGLIEKNPAEGVQIKVAKPPKGTKVRRPFNADELAALFSAPLFTGCHSKGRRSLPGDVVIKDAKFWLPILGFVTGARLGELVQLHVKDVFLSGPVPYISINEDAAPPSADGAAKHVKSKAGIRRVPLHPDVMALGFAEFVAHRALSNGKSRVRLFPEMALGKDGQASTVASKWFARFLDSVKLSDPLLVFHSFRHAAEDAFRNAETLQYITDRIIGHTDGTTSSGYGEGAALEVLYQAVCGMKLKVSLPDLIH